VLANHGDAGLNPTRRVHGSRMHGDEPHATPLVEADRVDVVIRGDEPHSLTATCGGLFSDRREERGPNPVLLPQRIERDQFALRVVESKVASPTSSVPWTATSAGRHKASCTWPRLTTSVEPHDPSSCCSSHARSPVCGVRMRMLGCSVIDVASCQRLPLGDLIKAGPFPQGSVNPPVARQSKDSPRGGRTGRRGCRAPRGGSDDQTVANPIAPVVRSGSRRSVRDRNANNAKRLGAHRTRWRPRYSAARRKSNHSCCGCGTSDAPRPSGGVDPTELPRRWRGPVIDLLIARVGTRIRRTAVSARSRTYTARTNEAMAAAVRKAAYDWRAILSDWNES